MYGSFNVAQASSHRCLWNHQARSRTILLAVYHQLANSLVKRFHQQLKALLSAPSISQWTNALTLVLLGICNAVKPGVGYAAAQLGYGTSFQHSGEFVASSSSSMNRHLNHYISTLTTAMRSFKLVSTRFQSTDVFIQHALRYPTQQSKIWKQAWYHAFWKKTKASGPIKRILNLGRHLTFRFIAIFLYDCAKKHLLRL